MYNPEIENLIPDTSRLTADLAAEFIIEHPEHLGAMIDACFEGPGPIPMRASRVVYLIGVLAPELISPYLVTSLKRVQESDNESVIRNFFHLFMEQLDRLDETSLGILVSMSFNYLENAGTAIGIRAYSLQILYEISQKIPDIKPELIAVIRYHLDESSTALKTQGKRILKKLNREIIG